MRTWTLQVKRKFDSAHKLNCYNGACANLHGHTWEFQVHVQVTKLMEGVEFGVDFKDVKKTIDEHITDKFDHNFINDILPQPTAENIASYILDTLNPIFKEKFGASVTQVDVWETANSCVSVTDTQK